MSTIVDTIDLADFAGTWTWTGEVVDHGDSAPTPRCRLCGWNHARYTFTLVGLREDADRHIESRTIACGETCLMNFAERAQVGKPAVFNVAPCDSLAELGAIARRALRDAAAVKTHPPRTLMERVMEHRNLEEAQARAVALRAGRRRLRVGVLARLEAAGVPTSNLADESDAASWSLVALVDALGHPVTSEELTALHPEIVGRAPPKGAYRRVVTYRKMADALLVWNAKVAAPLRKHPFTKAPAVLIANPWEVLGCHAMFMQYIDVCAPGLRGELVACNL